MNTTAPPTAMPRGAPVPKPSVVKPSIIDIGASRHNPMQGRASSPTCMVQQMAGFAMEPQVYEIPSVESSELTSVSGLCAANSSKDTHYPAVETCAGLGSSTAGLICGFRSPTSKVDHVMITACTMVSPKTARELVNGSGVKVHGPKAA